MTTKFKALLAAIVSGTCGFISWLATVPPEQQSGWLAQLVELTPVQYRPNVALFTRVAMLFLGIYAVRQSSHSGPQSPPVNQPS